MLALCAKILQRILKHASEVAKSIWNGKTATADSVMSLFQGLSGLQAKERTFTDTRVPSKDWSAQG